MIVRGSSYTPAPEGFWSGCCVDIVDLGIIQTNFGMKPMLRIVWELECTMDDGRRYTISKRYTPSLHEKSQLHKDLKSWRGRAFTTEELNGFDLDTIIGAPCKILVEHVEREGNVYGNIKAITKSDRDGKLLPSGKYIRVQDRPEQQQHNGHSHGQQAGGFVAPAGETDEDQIPF